MQPTRKYSIPNQDGKSPAISPPRKDTTTNQDSKRIITQQYPILPPLLAKYLTGYKPLLMIRIIQIKHMMTLIILQIIHIMRFIMI